MKNSILFVACLSAVALSACNRDRSFRPAISQIKTDVPVIPKVDIPNFGQTSENDPFFTCAKNPAGVTDAMLENAIVIEGQTKVQDLESVDCAGKVTKTSKAPARSFTYELLVVPPPSFRFQGDKVSHVKVSNTSTCVTRTIYRAKEGQDMKNISSLWQSRPEAPYFLDQQGQLVLGLTDRILKILPGFPVKSGLNQFQIVYYGDCRAGDSPAGGDCQPWELGRQDVLVKANIENVSVEGTRRINVCAK